MRGAGQKGAGDADQRPDDPEPAGDAAHAGTLVVALGAVGVELGRCRASPCIQPLSAPADGRLSERAPRPRIFKYRLAGLVGRLGGASLGLAVARRLALVGRGHLRHLRRGWRRTVTATTSATATRAAPIR